MGVWIGEKAEGGPRIQTKPPEYSTDYVIAESTDGATVRALVQAYAPLQVIVDSNTLDRDNITIARQGNADDVWDATVTWVLKPPTPNSSIPITFDTGGGTAKTVYSINDAVVTRTTAGADKPVPKNECKKMIGYTTRHEPPEGVDITVPSFSWTETYTMPVTSITFAYAMTLTGLTGKVNDASFRGFAAGEVLFMGASGGKQKDEDTADVQFRFNAAPNVAGEDILGATVDKKGWDYLWFYCGTTNVEDPDDATKKVKIEQPWAVVVSEVYDEADFSAMGIGTGVA